MPELPDVALYVERLRERIVGRVLRRVSVPSPFLLRTAVPPLGEAEGRHVVAVERMAKRLLLGLEGDLWLVVHLMIAGRLRWLEPGARPPGRITLAVFAFDEGDAGSPVGSLVLTEAGSRRRAALHVMATRAAVQALDAGGLDPLAADDDGFVARLKRENHTLKRALTDPRLFSGIGNAYSDEILHRARLSPLALTSALSEADARRLAEATRAVLAGWSARLAADSPGWPDKVTAFHPDMAVHGRYGQPCPACNTPVQRIVYAENEANYCPRCQTGGRLLADRALSRLLKASWPRSVDDL